MKHHDSETQMILKLKLIVAKKLPHLPKPFFKFGIFRQSIEKDLSSLQESFDLVSLIVK